MDKAIFPLLFLAKFPDAKKTSILSAFVGSKFSVESLDKLDWETMTEPLVFITLFISVKGIGEEEQDDSTLDDSKLLKIGCFPD